MRIILSQEEIEEAVENLILDQVDVPEDMRIDIVLKATRGEEGYTAEIDILLPTAPNDGSDRSVDPRIDVADGAEGLGIAEKVLEAKRAAELPRRRGRPAGARNRPKGENEQAQPVEVKSDTTLNVTGEATGETVAEGAKAEAGEAEAEALDAGAPTDEAEALGEVVEEKVDDAIGEQPQPEPQEQGEQAAQEAAEPVQEPVSGAEASEGASEVEQAPVPAEDAQAAENPADGMGNALNTQPPEAEVQPEPEVEPEPVVEPAATVAEGDMSSQASDVLTENASDAGENDQVGNQEEQTPAPEAGDASAPQAQTRSLFANLGDRPNNES